jgi:hypothetical protein
VLPPNHSPVRNSAPACITICHRNSLWVAFVNPILLLLFACFAYFAVQSPAAETFAILKPAAFAHHIERFNTMEPETVVNHIPNSESWTWLQKNIPLFECPDREVEEMYFFRWWSFRKHLKQTPKGFVITEFLTPVSHAGEFNTISCATSLHIAEARWLRDDRYLNDYTEFWLRGEDGKPARKFHNFSSWLAAATWDRYLVNTDQKFLLQLLPDLVADYRAWETERQLPNGLFWQYDVRDGMEESISGSRRAQNIRPTINTYMFANARAIADMARLASTPALAQEFTTKATALKRLTQENLWDPNANFFKVLVPSVPSDSYTFSTAREAIGFIPWMFNLPDPHPDHAAAFAQLTDPQGFAAPFGLTTAERRHPEFRNRGVGTCEWDGALWPFATSQTLYALANYLRPPEWQFTPHAPRPTPHVFRRVPHLHPQPIRPRETFHRRVSRRSHRRLDQRQERPQPLLQPFYLRRSPHHRRHRLNFPCR